MTRVEALEAVASAARSIFLRHEDLAQKRWRHGVLSDALSDLDALPAAPTQAQAQGETVVVAVWEDPEDGDIQLARIGGAMDRDRAKYHGWTRLGTTLLPIRATEGGGE